jgi:hypothetical protein
VLTGDTKSNEKEVYTSYHSKCNNLKTLNYTVKFIIRPFSYSWIVLKIN